MERHPGDDRSWRIQVVDLNGDGLPDLKEALELRTLPIQGGA